MVIVQAADSTKCRRGKPGELLELRFVLLGKVSVVVFVRELEQTIIAAILSNDKKKLFATQL